MSNPKLKLNYTTTDYLVEVLSIALQLASIVTLIVYYSALPDSIPMRYTLKGEVTSSGSPAILIILVFISLFTYSKMTLLSRFPHIHNFPVKVTEANAAQLYRISFEMLHFLKLLISALFFYLVWQTIQIGIGRAASLNGWLMIVLVGSIGIIPIWSIIRMIRYRKNTPDLVRE